MRYKNLKIELLGHSAFLIKNSALVYIDPFQLKTNEKADIIFITHGHYDHCSLQDIEKIVKKGTIIIIPAGCQSKVMKLEEDVDIKILNPGEQAIIKGIKVKAVPSYNTNKPSHPKGDGWNGYVLDFDNVRIYHAGDTDMIPEMSPLREIDIALLPVDGKFAMSADEAAKAAEIIKPKLAIPMHYGTVAGTKEDAERFVRLCMQKGIKAEIMEKI
jgi:L-ascorbate metabolism protein UlaG (beta-lactamase superfamily)